MSDIVNIDEFISNMRHITAKINELRFCVSLMVVLDELADKLAEENGRGTPNYDKYYFPYMDFKEAKHRLALEHNCTYTFNKHNYQLRDCSCDGLAWDSDDETQELTDGLFLCCKCKGIRGCVNK